MIISVSPDLNVVALDDAENVRAFKVVVAAAPAAASRLGAALRGIAVLTDTQTAWVHERWLRERTGHARDAAWQDGISAMLAAAAAFGWYDQERRTIRAQIEWCRAPVNT